MTEFFKKYWIIILIAGFVFFICGIMVLPECYIYSYFGNLSEKDKLDAIRDIRSNATYIAGGVLAIIGIYLTWRRTNALDNQNENTREQIRILDNKNRNDQEASDKNLVLQQFSKASELLKDENIAARLSGIYLFEQIMNTNKDYHTIVIEILTAFVREKRGRYGDRYYVGMYREDMEIFEEDLENFEKKINFSGKTMFKINEIYEEYSEDEGIDHVERLGGLEYYKKVPIEKDIQAIITVLGRRNTDFEEIVGNFEQKRYLDLSNTNLYKADLSSSSNEYVRKQNYDYFNFSGSILVESNCNDSNFKNAFCIEAHFENAQCTEAHFEHAQCTAAYFENADCYKAHFEHDNCWNAHFEHAICSDAHFEHASFAGASFENTWCGETHFENTDCYEAHFEHAKRITAKQLSKVFTLKGATGLSDEMKEEIVSLNPKLKSDLFPEEVEQEGDEQEPESEGDA